MTLEITYISPFAVLFFRSVLIASTDYLKLFCVSLQLKHIWCLLYVNMFFYILFSLCRLLKVLFCFHLFHFCILFIVVQQKNSRVALRDLRKLFGKYSFRTPFSMKQTRPRLFSRKLSEILGTVRMQNTLFYIRTVKTVLFFC